MSKTHLTEQKFSDFALHPKVVEALEKKGFHNCTPIQALALPLTLAGWRFLRQRFIIFSLILRLPIAR